MSYSQIRNSKMTAGSPLCPESISVHDRSSLLLTNCLHCPTVKRKAALNSGWGIQAKDCSLQCPVCKI
ncbi:hypothetical protein MPTK1_2g01430 [Marchantia polymorpha subsp. ruderalis]|uniref:Uncharacterized protein n=1 Tax=Marchantia polymorpha TaxID=3197 RepID=A0A2R6X9B9_MARPO|nr:hypothetical protein MARPO_0028s0009 [Marchantia polymorpha]BBN00714.1 hypothetical protein Mp_2g01430 [Marchantia polymorpha subsp. ruderalis]|eukprot:PTQ42682.1 hypothetical protein MARPO_0028s0009 [Marchantia polymorpha]